MKKWNTLYYDKDQIYDIFGFCYFFNEIYPDQWLLVNISTKNNNKKDEKGNVAAARALNQTTPSLGLIIKGNFFCYFYISLFV